MVATEATEDDRPIFYNCCCLGVNAKPVVGSQAHTMVPITFMALKVEGQTKQKLSIQTFFTFCVTY